MLTCLAISDHLKPERMPPSTTRGSHEKTRFTEEQMVTILREADEKSVQKVAKKHGAATRRSTTPITNESGINGHNRQVDCVTTRRRFQIKASTM